MIGAEGRVEPRREPHPSNPCLAAAMFGRGLPRPVGVMVGGQATRDWRGRGVQSRSCVRHDPSNLELDDGDDLLDCGRLTAARRPRRSSVTPITCCWSPARPSRTWPLLRDRLPWLQRIGLRPRLLLVDDGVYRTEEVTDAIGAGGC